VKRLLLLRHAKAVAKDAARDFDRVLSDRGRSDMAVMAEPLADPALAPGLALVSPSARTRETWTLAGMPDVTTRFEPTIYEATSDTLLSVVRGVPDDVSCVIMVGHNPGLEELALGLGGGAAGGGEGDLLQSGLPTAALVVFDFPAEGWRAVALKGGRLDRVVTPASLGGGGG